MGPQHRAARRFSSLHVMSCLVDRFTIKARFGYPRVGLVASLLFAVMIGYPIKRKNRSTKRKCIDFWLRSSSINNSHPTLSGLL